MSDLPPGFMDKLFNAYAALNRHKDKFAVIQSPDPGDGRQLEYYPPWETDNPVPDKATVELYRQQMAPGIMQNLVAGDMMHYLGSTDPRTNQPVDQTFNALKQQFLGTMTPEQQAVNQQAYDSEKKFYPNPPSMDDWMQFNRGDAFIRGYLTPDEHDEWRKQGVYTEEQKQQLEKLRQYITRGSIAPGMNR